MERRLADPGTCCTRFGIAASACHAATPGGFLVYIQTASKTDIDGGLGEKALDFANSLTRGQAIRTSTFYMLVTAFGFVFVITIQVMLLQTVPFVTDAGFDRNTAALMITVASIPALLSKPIWGWLIDGLDAKPLAAISVAATGISLFVIVFAAQSGSLGLLIAGFALMGFGWGGMIPLQEVIWATFFGRRYLGAVRSTALLTLLITASSPIATSYYRDVVGNYDGAIITVGVLNLVSAVMIMMLKKPNIAAKIASPETSGSGVSSASC